MAPSRRMLDKQRKTNMDLTRLVQAGQPRAEGIVNACVPQADAQGYVAEIRRLWLEARGTHVQYRASLEQDMAAMRDVKPDLALGTTPLVQAAKERGIPAVYFTNIVSARPLFGPAGAGAMAGIVPAQTAGRERFTSVQNDDFPDGFRRAYMHAHPFMVFDLALCAWTNFNKGVKPLGRERQFGMTNDMSAS